MVGRAREDGARGFARATWATAGPGRLPGRPAYMHEARLFLLPPPYETPSTTRAEE